MAPHQEPQLPDVSKARLNVAAERFPRGADGSRPFFSLTREPPGGEKDGIISRMPVFLNIRPFEVNPDYPHANDALGREKDCIMLADLIEETGGPFTLAVDAEWGNGKTVFIRMLEAYLAKRDFRCVSFSAWECDFYDEPLAPLIAEIGGKIGADATAGNKLLDEGAKLLGLLRHLKGAAFLAPDPAALGAAALGAASEAALQVLERGEEKKEKHPLIRDYRDYRDALKEFKDSLREAAQPDRPLVVFIDELDRCRPDFAVNFLERVKHVFDVPSLVFVMAVNRRELASVVKSFYGCGDGEKYLEKFFDLVFHLRNEKTLVGASLKKVGIGRFLDRIRSSPDGGLHDEATHVKWLTGYLESLSETFGFSLRVQQKLARTLRVALTTANYRFTSREFFAAPEDLRAYWHVAFRYPLLCYFLALRVANPDLFRRSVECSSQEAFPWVEHFGSYQSELGVKAMNEERSFDIEHLEPLLPVKYSPGDDDLSALKIVRPDERVLINLSLLALADSWRTETTGNFIGRFWRYDDSRMPRVVEVVGRVYRGTMKDYGSFREFLRAVDFAGKFYQRES